MGHVQKVVDLALVLAVDLASKATLLWPISIAKGILKRTKVIAMKEVAVSKGHCESFDGHASCLFNVIAISP